MYPDPYLSALQHAAYAAIGVDAFTVAQTMRRGRVHIMLTMLAQSAWRLEAADYAEFRRAACARADSYGKGGDGRDRMLTSFDTLLTDVADRVLALARELFDRPGLQVPCGALPTARVEAMVIAAPHPQRYRIVVTDEWFPTFANLLAKVLARVAIQLDAGDREVLAFGSPTVTRFLELMLATLGGRPSAAPQYMPEPEPSFTARHNAALAAIETFVVARPMAHLALGHTASREPAPVALPGVEVDAFQFEEAQVHQADMAALLLTLRAPDLGGLEQFTVWSVDMFLATLAMLDHARARAGGPKTGGQARLPGRWFAGGRSETLSDATMSRRRAALRNSLTALEKRSANEHRTDARPIAEVLASRDFIPQVLWQHLCAVLDAR